MFRTTELSDPRFETGNLRYITVKTPNLKGRGDICVFVPPLDTVANLPLVLLLHGVYGGAWVWTQKAGVHLSAWQMMEDGDIPPMAIAMPSDGLWGDGSGYVPHNGHNFEKWIIEDVPKAVMANVTSVGKKSPLFISGLSMGGFGALRLGVKYREKFKAISAHSSITDLDQMALFVEEPLEGYLQEDERENSVWSLIQDNPNNLPKLRFDCGTEDLLLEYNRKLHQQLQDKRIDHIYEEFPGGHQWEYWSEHIKDTLRFFGGTID
ncbi:alpha/beta hydrolase-fold protein [Ulvibacterium sp.]|uniref:alpha/beta hydrolase n=1 Tax=Ulvibacterium sp. TaxID=2665914 RepID=UPI002613E299|nr:alpha/beta hydrolase-fold protein [Ulvibacterium sp.]